MSYSSSDLVTSGQRKYLYISGWNRSDGTPNSFTAVINPTIVNVRTIRLESCVIPYSFYDIDGQYLPLSEDGTTIVPVSVPRQHYSPTELATAWSLALSVASPNSYVYTVTYNYDTLGYTFASTGNFAFLWTTDYNLNPANNMYTKAGYIGTTSGLTHPAPDTTLAGGHVSVSAGILTFEYLSVTVRPIFDSIIANNIGVSSFLVRVNGNFGDLMSFDRFSSCETEFYIKSAGTNLSQITVTIQRPFNAVNTAIDFNGLSPNFLFSYTQYEDKTNFAQDRYYNAS